MNKQLRYRMERLHKINSYLADHKKCIVFLFLLELFIVAIEMGKPLLYQNFIDEIIGNKNKAILPYVLGGYVLLLILEMSFQWLSVKCHNKVLFHLLMKVKLTIWKQFQQIDPVSCDSEGRTKESITLTPSDQKMILENDIEKVGTLVYEQSIQYAVNLLMIIYTSLMMLTVKWSMALLGFISIPLTLYIDYFIGKKEKVLNEENRKNDANMNAWLHKSMDDWKDYRLWGIQKRQKKDYEVFQSNYANYNKRWINYWVARILVIPQLKNEFLMKLIVYLVGGYLISKSELTIGQLLLFLMYYTYFSDAVQTIANKNAVLLEDTPNMDRVFEQMEEQPQQVRTKKLNEIKKIEMNEVTFQYATKEVLHNWNLTVSQGNMIALDGESGRGKSTCIKLLLNLLEPTSGSIKINGMDLKEIQREDYYARISCVMQESMLFNGSIRDNLKYANANATEEEMFSCCRIAGIDKSIASWKEGLDTIIGEKGIKLSGGERQRICLARALLKKSDVLILDEATSALDTKCEYEVWEKIKEAMKDKIIIVITHRDTVKTLCDCVVRVGD